MSRTSAHTKKHTPRYALRDLFDDDELALKLLIARHRIMKAFDYATFWSHGKMRGTDNFIVGVGPRQKDLVKYVLDRVVVGACNGIVAVNDLPHSIDQTAKVLRQIARDAESRILAVQISFMVQDGRLWFEEQIPGTWNVLQSCMDDYRLNRHVAQEANRVDAISRRESLYGGGRLMVVH